MSENIQWKPINIENGKYAESYLVSNTGLVMTMLRGRRQVLSLLRFPTGYVGVSLAYKGKLKRFSVHRIVGSAFLPNHENKPQINHINGIKNDNRVGNLEWCTRLENFAHAKINGLMKPLKGENNPMFGRKGKDHPSFGRTGILNGVYGKVGFMKGKTSRMKGVTGKNHPLYGKKPINCIVVFDTQTGIFYDTIKEAANAKCVPHSSLVKMLSGSMTNRTSFIYA